MYLNPKWFKTDKIQKVEPLLCKHFPRVTIKVNCWNATQNALLCFKYCNHARFCLPIFQTRSVFMWCYGSAYFTSSSFQLSQNHSFYCKTSKKMLGRRRSIRRIAVLVSVLRVWFRWMLLIFYLKIDTWISFVGFASISCVQICIICMFMVSKLRRHF